MTRHRTWNRLVSVVLICGIVLLMVRPALVAAAQPDPYERARAMLDRALTTLEQGREAIDPAGFDLGARARALGPEPRALFEFVRDEVGYEAYWGSLRGAQGTLEGLAGNSLDQSLLLQELLIASGFGDATVIAGTLDAARVEELLDSMFERDGLFVPPAAIAGGPGVEEMADVFEIESALVRQAVAENEQFDRLAVARAYELAVDDAWLVADAVGLVASEIPVDGGAQRRALRTAASAHFWVRVTDASGASMELDPSFRTATYGETFGLQGVAMTEADLTAWEHGVSVRLVLERLEGTELKTELLWERPLSPGEVNSADIAFEIVPYRLDADRFLDGDLAGTDLLGQIDATRAFQPLVKVGGEDQAGHPFDIEGNKLGVDDGVPVFAAFNAAANALENLFGDPPPARELAAIWVEVEVDDPTPGETSSRQPGSGSVTYRSMILDRLSAASRAAGVTPELAPDAPSGVELKRQVVLRGEVGLTSAVRSRGSLLAHDMDRFLAARNGLENLLALRFDRELPHRLGEAYAGADALATRSWALAAEKLALWHPLGDGSVRIYYDRPRVTVFTDRVTLSDGTPVRAVEMDVLDNRLAVVPAFEDPDSFEIAHSVRLVQGAGETLLEALLLGDDTGVVNTHNVIVRALEQQIELLTLTQGDDLDTLGFEDGLRRQLEAELSGNVVVLVPARPVSFPPDDEVTAYWRYDADTGTLIGRGPTGKGQAFAEYLTVTRLIAGIPIGLFIGAVFCAYFRASTADEWVRCVNLTLMGEILSILALIPLIGLMGPVWGLMAAFAFGMAMTGYGVATNNELAVEAGLGLALAPVGAAFGEVLEAASPAVRETFEDIATVLAQRFGRGTGSQLVPAVATAGARAGTRSGVRVGSADAFAMSARAPRSGARVTGQAGRQSSREVGEAFEREVATSLTQGMRRFDNAAGEPLRRMRQVISGHYGNGVQGIDQFGIDEAGEAYIIEVSKGTRRVEVPIPDARVRSIVDDVVRGARSRAERVRRMRDFVERGRSGDREVLEQVRRAFGLSDGVADRQLRKWFENQVLPYARVFEDAAPGTGFKIPHRVVTPQGAVQMGPGWIDSNATRFVRALEDHADNVARARRTLGLPGNASEQTVIARMADAAAEDGASRSIKTLSNTVRNGAERVRNVRQLMQAGASESNEAVFERFAQRFLGDVTRDAEGRVVQAAVGPNVRRIFVVPDGVHVPPEDILRNYIVQSVGRSDEALRRAARNLGLPDDAGDEVVAAGYRRFLETGRGSRDAAAGRDLEAMAAEHRRAVREVFDPDRDFYTFRRGE